MDEISEQVKLKFVTHLMETTWAETLWRIPIQGIPFLIDFWKTIRWTPILTRIWGSAYEAKLCFTLIASQMITSVDVFDYDSTIGTRFNRFNPNDCLGILWFMVAMVLFNCAPVDGIGASRTRELKTSGAACDVALM